MSVVIKLEERPAKISNKNNNKKEHTRREGCNKKHEQNALESKVC